MDLARLKTLIDFVRSSGVSELEIVEGGEKIRIVGGKHAGKDTGGRVPTKPVPGGSIMPDVKPLSTEAVLPVTVDSPMFGVCHLAPSPGAPAFVSVGDRMAPGQTLCLIEAMKMFTRVEAARAGIIKAILVESGSEIEAGQPLFRVEG